MESREQILKSIVYEINDFIKKTRKNQQTNSFLNLNDFLTNLPCPQSNSKNKINCDGFYLKFEQQQAAPTQYDCKCAYLKKLLQNNKITAIPFHKIEPYWPLKKGMVDTPILAWHEVSSSAESVQYALAFMIKFFSTTIYRNNFNLIPKELEFSAEAKNLIYIHNILFNPKSSFLFWSEIKKYYLHDFHNENHEKKLRAHFYNNLLPKKTLIVLCFEETFFRLRSGTNFELYAFEQFINDLTNSDNSLIVFSMQKLLTEKDKLNNYKTDFTISYKKSLDEKKVSLQHAMEPDYKISKDERFIEPNRIGAFDRLIELLAKGQNIISSLEKDFLEWKTKAAN
ncbi:hypothetical protein AXG55_01900 [Silvanigrella aquatica]|uniref:Uncharacterized protein n=2 Tax=Silvanigrella aquatica TaxID=1915309 RepID=A0A1L4CXQ8_9BACT|nr:hypothetical protein AXG55_01900 [Silvanigrella aquatica]